MTDSEKTTQPVDKAVVVDLTGVVPAYQAVSGAAQPTAPAIDIPLLQALNTSNVEENFALPMPMEISPESVVMSPPPATPASFWQQAQTFFATILEYIVAWFRSVQDWLNEGEHS